MHLRLCLQSRACILSYNCIVQVLDANVKVVQKLTGCLAALSRFISRLGEKAMPFYRLLRKEERFTWSTEAQEAFDRLKALFSSLPVLTSPTQGETLLLYIAATSKVVSTVLVKNTSTIVMHSVTAEEGALPQQWKVHCGSAAVHDRLQSAEKQQSSCYNRRFGSLLEDTKQ